MKVMVVFRGYVFDEQVVETATEKNLNTMPALVDVHATLDGEDVLFEANDERYLMPAVHTLRRAMRDRLEQAKAQQQPKGDS